MTSEARDWADAAAGRRSAIVIGPGKIGCGFLAPLLAGAGWTTVMTTRTAATRDRIRARRVFEICTGSRRRSCDVEAVVSIDDNGFDAAVADADLILTAVGADRVAGLGRPLARALATRPQDAPVDVWVVENGDVAPVLERAVHGAAAERGLALPPVGFAGAVAMPIVARGSWRADEEPVFVRDAVDTLLVDVRRTLRGLPRLPGVVATSQYRERLREKMYCFGCGHLLLAYLGSWAGYRVLDGAARDANLSAVVRRCLLDARRAFVRAYPELGGDVAGPVAEAIRRYRNAALADPIARVARNPMRKLRADGPLVGPAALMRETLGHESRALALGVATVLLYRDDDDAQARELAAMLRTSPVAHVLSDLCGLSPRDPFVTAATRAYGRLRRLAALPELRCRRAQPRPRWRRPSPLVLVTL
jgi:mannitol-1-phosphate 5-dehydrogenase